MTSKVSGTPARGLLRIGEVAVQARVSPRTLRYYEELGLLAPIGRSAGGARRYAEADVSRLRRIRELQELLGFDLSEIGVILRSEDQLADLRRQFHGGVGLERQRAIVAEATEINARLRALVRAKQDRLDDMLRDLESAARRYRTRARELAGPGGGPGPGSPRAVTARS